MKKKISYFIYFITLSFITINNVNAAKVVCEYYDDNDKYFVTLEIKNQKDNFYVTTYNGEAIADERGVTPDSWDKSITTCPKYINVSRNLENSAYAIFWGNSASDVNTKAKNYNALYNSQGTLSLKKGNKEEQKKENQENKTEEDIVTTLDQICYKEGVLKSFRFFGYLLFIVKIAVPLILIIMGSVDFGKAMLESNQEAVVKSAKALGYKIAAGVIVFLVPTVVNYFFGLFDYNAESYIDGQSTFANCRTCVFEPNNCNIEKDSSGNAQIVNNVTNKKEAKAAINKVRKEINNIRKKFNVDSCGTVIVCSNTLDNLEDKVTQAESDIKKYIANGYVTEEASAVKKFRTAAKNAKSMIKKNRKKLKEKSS